jgi:hypothetical protein
MWYGDAQSAIHEFKVAIRIYLNTLYFIFLHELLCEKLIYSTVYKLFIMFCSVKFMYIWVE